MGKRELGEEGGGEEERDRRVWGRGDEGERGKRRRRKRGLGREETRKRQINLCKEGKG